MLQRKQLTIVETVSTIRSSTKRQESTMQLRTQREMIRVAVSYFVNNHLTSKYNENCQRIAQELSKVNPETITADEIDSIIGSTGWTSPETCDECGNKSYESVLIGELGDNGCSVVCLDCLKKAVKLIEESAM